MKILAKIVLTTIILVFFMGVPFHVPTALANASVVGPNTYMVGILRDYVVVLAHPKKQTPFHPPLGKERLRGGILP